MTCAGALLQTLEFLQAVRALEAAVAARGGEVVEATISAARDGSEVAGAQAYVWAFFSEEAGGGVDVEWVFPEDDAIADARALSRRGAPGGRVGRALARAQGERLLEALRLDLGWAKVPIIRNRQRALGFVESPLDRFGPEPPPSIDDYGKAGPPAADPQLF